MQAKSLGLVWIVVKDFKRAVQFYTQVVGLKLIEMNEEWGWAELEGHEGGTRLGIAQTQSDHKEPVKPGQNAVMTFDVENIDKAVQDLIKKGASLVGEIEEVPGHVKMQTLKDTEGNCIQIVQVLAHHHPKHSEKSSCCG